MAVNPLIKQVSNYRGGRGASATAGKSIADHFYNAGLTIPAELTRTKPVMDGYMKSRLATHQAQQRAGGLQPATGGNRVTLEQYNQGRFGQPVRPSPGGFQPQGFVPNTGTNVPSPVPTPEVFSGQPPGLQGPTPEDMQRLLDEFRIKMEAYNNYSSRSNPFMQNGSAFDRMRAESIGQLLRNRFSLR